MRDDKLVPEFFKALMESDQAHVALMLGYKGVCVCICCIAYFISVVDYKS